MSLFRPTPYLELIVAGGTPDRFAVRKQRFVIGSSAEADMVISHPSVDGEHVILEQTPNGWTAAAVGLAPVILNDLSLSSRAIYSGDTIDIDGIVNLVFRDPIEDKARAKAEKAGKSGKTGGKAGAAPAKPSRNRYLLLAVVLSVLVSVTIIAFGTRSSTPVPDVRTNTPASVRAAIETGRLRGAGNALPLAECIAKAAEGQSVSAWVRVGKTPFWWLAQTYSGQNDLTSLKEDAQFVGLKQELEQKFLDGRIAEANAQKGQAREAYGSVIGLVPVANCSVYLLATARLNVLGGTR